MSVYYHVIIYSYSGDIIDNWTIGQILQQHSVTISYSSGNLMAHIIYRLYKDDKHIT